MIVHDKEFIDKMKKFSFKKNIVSSIGIPSSNWSTAYTNVAKYTPKNVVSMSIKESNMTPDNRPVHIYFANAVPQSLKSEIFDQCESNLQRKIVCCSSWSEMAELLKLHPKSMCVNSSYFENQSLIEVLNMISTLAKLVGIGEPMTITLGVTKETPLNLVKEAQKLQVIGVIPSSVDYGLEETLRGCVAQWNNIPYWPKHILDALPGAKKMPKPKTGEIKLTPRQKQILSLIKERGASNKVIAKTLNITESTVKLHVGIVLKKFGVKNRTQLALFSK